MKPRRTRWIGVTLGLAFLTAQTCVPLWHDHPIVNHGHPACGRGHFAAHGYDGDISPTSAVAEFSADRDAPFSAPVSSCPACHYQQNTYAFRPMPTARGVMRPVSAVPFVIPSIPIPRGDSPHDPRQPRAPPSPSFSV